MALRFLSNQTIDSTLDLTGRVKVSGSNTDQYYFEGQRNGVGVTYRLYDNSNNVYRYLLCLDSAVAGSCLDGCLQPVLYLLLSTSAEV